MREKLLQHGLNSEITIIGQYVRTSGGILLANIFDFDTDEYLCDHLWIPKPCSDILCFRKANDFMIVTGKIVDYTKQSNKKDYGVKYISKVKFIKPLVFKDGIVYLPYSRYIQYWYFKYRKGYNTDDYSTEDYSKVEHLYINDNKEGYHIVNENAEFFDVCYKEKGSSLRVFKTIKGAKEQLKQEG